jgi:hypothetical protein
MLPRQHGSCLPFQTKTQLPLEMAMSLFCALSKAPAEMVFNFSLGPSEMFTKLGPLFVIVTGPWTPGISFPSPPHHTPTSLP